MLRVWPPSEATVWPTRYLSGLHTALERVHPAHDWISGLE
jgi:hypothetical protein